MRRPPFDGAKPARGVILLNCTTSEQSAHGHCADIFRRLPALGNDGAPFPVYFFDMQERFYSWMYAAQADDLATRKMVRLSCTGLPVDDAPLPLTAYDLRHSDALPRVRSIFMLTNHGRAHELLECPPKYAFELRDLWIWQLRAELPFENVLAAHRERHASGKLIDLWWLYAYTVDPPPQAGELLSHDECAYVLRKSELLRGALSRTHEYHAAKLRLAQLEKQISAAVDNSLLQAFVAARLEYLSTYDPVAIYHLGKLHRMRNASGAPAPIDELWWLNCRRDSSKDAALRLQEAYLVFSEDEEPALTMNEYFQVFDGVHGIGRRFALVYYLDFSIGDR